MHPGSGCRKDAFRGEFEICRALERESTYCSEILTAGFSKFHGNMISLAGKACTITEVRRIVAAAVKLSRSGRGRDFQLQQAKDARAGGRKRKSYGTRVKRSKRT